MDSAAIACGDCFRWAVRDAAEHGGVVVHGVVMEPLSVPPRLYEHAWVERGGTVYDWQTMVAGHGGKYRGRGFPRDVFYELFAPQKVVKYDAGEAVGMAARTGHYGPWDARVARNPATAISEAPGVHELEDRGGVTLRYRVPGDRPATPTPRDRWLRKHPYYDEYMGEYYTWDPSLSIREMLRRWEKFGAKAYSNLADSMELATGEHFEGIYSAEELWPYRRDDRPVNPALAKGLEEHGWLAPILLRIGKNGCVEIGEGNHRIRVAHEKRLRFVPVRFWFVQEAPCVSDAERRERAIGYERARMLEERERDVVPGSIKFYTQDRPLKFNPATRKGRIRVHDHDEWTKIIDWLPDVEGYAGIVDDPKSFRGTSVGVGGYLIATQEGPDLRVEYIEVDEEFGRQGVATRLYEEALGLARKSGGTLRSDTRLESGAQAFWQKMREAGLAKWKPEGFYEMIDGAKVLPNRASTMQKVEEEFDRAFDVIERKFPDFGDVELHEDERAGADNGAGAERQFAYCMEGDPIIIAFAPKAATLPKSHLKGLMRHEFGHALEYRFGVKELQRRLGRRLPEKVERRADVIAELVWDEPLVYDARDIQCVGVEGKSRRPKRLPDSNEKLRPNPSDVDYGKEAFVRRMMGEYPRTVAGSKFYKHVREGLPWCEVEIHAGDGSVTRLPMHLGNEWKLKDRGPDLWVERFREHFGKEATYAKASCGELGQERVLWEWPGTMSRNDGRQRRLPESLPEWARPDHQKLKELHKKTQGSAPKDWLDCLSDREVEEAIFGFSSLRGTITIDTDEIEWVDSEGSYDDIVEEVEEEGPEYYDTDSPIIVDLTWSGTFELNDGHHRYVANREFGDDHEMRAEVQIPPGLAREWARKLIASAKGGSEELLTVEALEREAGVPPEKWQGKCHHVAHVAAKMVGGTAVYGHWTGPVDAEGYWSDYTERPFVRHGWVRLSDGRILDPTRWSFENASPYIWVGENDGNYDEGGQKITRAMLPGAPPDDLTARQMPFGVGAECQAQLNALLGRDDQPTASVKQIAWLANLTPDQLGECVEEFYDGLDSIGMIGFVPADFQIMVRRR